MHNHVPDHVSRFRGKSLRQLIARKNEEFRRSMLNREIEVLVLEDGSAISSNFLRVNVVSDSPLNEWIRVRVTDLDGDGLQASRITTAAETSLS